MIYLSKILPIIFLPIGLTMVLVGAGLILRKKVLCWTGWVILLLLSTEFVSGKLMGWVEGVKDRSVIQDVKTADAIVVLSGMIEERKNASLGEWSDAVDRFEGGVELFLAGKAPLLIFTGGHVPWRPEDRPEGEILKERAVKMGVPGEKIVVTGKVGNTADEAAAVKVLLESLERREVKGGRRDNKQLTANGQQPTTLVGNKQWAEGGKLRIILVTSAFHMRRANMLFERQGFEVEPFPVDFQTSDNNEITILSFLPSAHALARSEIAIREIIGFAYYWVIGS